MKPIFLHTSDNKNVSIQQRILALCINEGDYSIAGLSKETGASIPTITKLVGELISEGYIQELGKMGISGGRKPSVYGLNADAGYFIGVDVTKNRLSLAVSNFQGSIIEIEVSSAGCPLDLSFNGVKVGDSLDYVLSTLGIDESLADNSALTFTDGTTRAELTFEYGVLSQISVSLA